MKVYVIVGTRLTENPVPNAVLRSINEVFLGGVFQYWNQAHISLMQAGWQLTEDAEGYVKDENDLFSHASIEVREMAVHL